MGTYQGECDDCGEGYICQLCHAGAIDDAAAQGQAAGIECATKLAKESFDRYVEMFLKSDGSDYVNGQMDGMQQAAQAIYFAIGQLSPDPNYLDRVRNEAAQRAAKETAEAGLYNEDGSYTLNAKVIAGRAAEEAATAALEQERKRIREIIRTVTPYNGYVWREDILAAIGDDKEE